MPLGCLEQAAKDVRARLTWRVSVLDGEGERVEAWSNPATRSHTIMLPPVGERDYHLLHGLILAEFAETRPPLVSSNKIWGVSIASQNLIRAFYLAAARDWFVTGRIATLCPDELRAALEAEAAMLTPVEPAGNPLTIDRMTLGSEEKDRILAALHLAKVRRWVDGGEKAADEVTEALAQAFGAVDPEMPGIEGMLGVVNGLCEVFDRRCFTANEEKGYWMVEARG